MKLFTGFEPSRFNNKIKVLKRRCYGLGNVTRLFKRLILDLTGFERFGPAMA